MQVSGRGRPAPRLSGPSVLCGLRVFRGKDEDRETSRAASSYLPHAAIFHRSPAPLGKKWHRAYTSTRTNYALRPAEALGRTLMLFTVKRRYTIRATGFT
jgi:hypothetical protein